MPTHDIQPWILQICHGYDSPFMDCARQYAGIFKGSKYKVLTVYLTGKPSEEVIQGTDSDEVLFLDFTSRDIGGLKLSAISRVRALANSRHCVLCIAHRFKSIHVALLGTGLPVIGINHAFDVYCRPARKWFVRLFKSRLLLIGVSNAVRDNIRHCLKGWPADRIETLYNRVDPDTLIHGGFPRDQARAALGIPQHAWVAATVGRLHPKKDQATLIRAFAAARQQLSPDAYLVVVGKGLLEADLKRLASELDVQNRVLFAGFVPDAWRYFKAFDEFFLATNREPFGMVLLEAMVAGVPVHSSDCGGAAEVVEGIGQLFNYQDEKGLTDVLISRFNANEDRAALERIMLERVKSCFSDDAIRQHFWSLPQVRKWISS